MPYKFHVNILFFTFELNLVLSTKNGRLLVSKLNGDEPDGAPHVGQIISRLAVPSSIHNSADDPTSIFIHPSVIIMN